MVQKHRISTNIGVDQKITVELKQDFDVLEILSLKFTQQQIYTSLCSDYGVVCGRVTANNGFGVGNVRVSIFVPLSEDDENDPVISVLYPYKEVTDKDENGYRYNLLPKRKQHGGHAETGTFPDQSDILEREEYLEVYEKYYRYTVKTNSAGDFMIWGVPVGLQTIHVDVDLSDIGCFSLRPADFQRLGIGIDSFKNNYTFKSSEDLDSLPQIISFNRNVEVYPFWGNEDLCEIGITRTDFDLSERGVNIQPKAYLIGGVFTDNGKNSVNKNCIPRRKMGRKCDMITKSANIEAIRFLPVRDELNRPYLEYLSIDEDVPDDGGFVLPLEMNMDYVITNEFGENEITNDPNKGIPTSACYRFRFDLKDNGLDRTRANADYLVPNIREYVNDVDKSYYFGTDYSGYPTDAQSLILNNVDGEYIPQDYFYRFTYNKVYTVSSFHSHFLGVDGLSKGLNMTAGLVTGGIFGAAIGGSVNRYNFANINEIVPSEEEDCGDKVTPPTNFGVKNYTFQLLIADFLLSLDYIYNLITLLVINTIAKLLYDVAEILVPISPKARPIRGVRNTFIANNGVALKLITYPDCDECVPNSENNNCQYYDTPYDDGLITGYFVEDPTVTQVISCNGENCSNVNILPGNTGRKFVQTSAQLQTEIAAGRRLLATAIYGDNNFVTRPTSYYPYGGGNLNGIVPCNHTGQKTLFGADYGEKNTFTPSSRTEFSNGVFYIVPGSQTNNRLKRIVDEYYRRKRVGKMFCGGIVNYGFIDNWLSGSLYFTQFKAKKFTKLVDATTEGVLKYCRNLVWFVFDQRRFYYRSASFNGTTGRFDKDKLNRPTTIVDLGPRDEFIKEICIDKKLDPNCSVSRSIGATSYQSLGEIMALAINYRMDVAGKSGNLDLFFSNKGFYDNLRMGNVLDGDILQLLSINNEVGIDQFDLESPKYLGYRFDILDPEDNETFFKVGSDWGPLPVTLELDEDGERIRACLNEPTHINYVGNTVQGRLTESSQIVPFYLWNKRGTGFGPGGVDRSNQSWDYNYVEIQPLQGMTYGYQFTGGTNDSSDKYLLLPMTKTNPGIISSTNLNLTNVIEFDAILPSGSTHTIYNTEYPGFMVLISSNNNTDDPTSGTLYIRLGNAGRWQIIPWTSSTDLIIPERDDYYSGTKQILSTPFQFYFGLYAGNTGLDKFIDRYGPKGAFTSAE